MPGADFATGPLQLPSASHGLGTREVGHRGHVRDRVFIVCELRQEGQGGRGLQHRRDRSAVKCVDPVLEIGRLGEFDPGLRIAIIDGETPGNCSNGTSKVKRMRRAVSASEPLIGFISVHRVVVRVVGARAVRANVSSFAGAGSRRLRRAHDASQGSPACGDSTTVVSSTASLALARLASRKSGAAQSSSVRPS